MNPLQRWRKLVAEHDGVCVTLLYVLHRMLQRASGGRAAVVPYLLMAQPVGSAALASMKPAAGFVMQRVGPGHALLPAFPRPGEVVAQRFADGAECFAATVNGQFAGHIWIARGRYVEDQVRCVYEISEPASGVWDFDVYVEPRFRIGRTMGRMWKAVDETLAAEGVEWSFSRINRFNNASLKSHQRLGALTVGRVTFGIIGRLQLGVGTAPGFMHISLPSNTVPKLRLRPPAPALSPRALDMRSNP